MSDQPNKFLIADDGSIYRINEDGSYTKMGHVNDLNSSHPGKPAPDTDDSTNPEDSWPHEPKWVKAGAVCGILSMVILINVILYILLSPAFFYNTPPSPYDTTTYIYEDSTAIEPENSTAIKTEATTHTYKKSNTPEPYYTEDSTTYTYEDSVAF